VDLRHETGFQGTQDAWNQREGITFESE
jgi:hypothetical protein